jgi:hypothetical protein
MNQLSPKNRISNLDSNSTSELQIIRHIGNNFYYINVDISFFLFLITFSGIDPVFSGA